MKSNIKNITLGILMVFLASCSQVVEDFDLQTFQPQIVINGMAQTDSTFSFFIGKTAMRNSLNNDWYNATPTKLELMRNGEGVVLSYSSDSLLFFADRIQVKPKDKFDINVQINGLERVSASMHVPDSTSFNINKLESDFVNNDDIYYPTDYEEDIYKQLLLDISFLIQDDPAETNYYGIKFEIGQYDYSFDYNDETGIFKVTDSMFAFLPYSVTSQDGIYEFKNAWGLEANGDITQEVSGSTLFFKDNLLPGLKNKISFNGEDYVSVKNAVKLRITLSTYSEGMYYYLRSLALYNTYVDFPLSEPIYIHSNIENGRGIFGAASRTSKTLVLKPD